MPTASQPFRRLRNWWGRSERQPETVAPLLTSWVSVLGGVESELTELNRSTEADFLAIGGMLSGLMSSAREISGEISAMTEVVSGEKGQEALDALSSVLERARNMQKGIQQTATSLHDLNALAVQVRVGFSGFQQTISSFRLVATLARIETERLGSMDSDLGHLAEEFRIHTTNVVSRVSELLDDVAAFETRIQAAITSVSRLLREKAQSLPAVVANVETNLDAFRQRQEEAKSESQHLAAGFGALSSAISGIVGAIQSHDITRQQIEHVAEALADIQKGTIDGGAEKPSPNDTLTLRVQRAQLQSAEKLFTTSVTQIEAQLRTVSTQIEQMMSSHGTLATTDANGDESFFTDLDRCFDSILESMAQYAELDASVEVAKGEFRDVIGRLHKSVSEVRTMALQVKWLAINARISAIHLGNPGEPLNIVAESMQGLQLDCETRCALTDRRVEDMQRVLELCATSVEGRSGGVISTQVRALVRELQSASQDGQDGWHRVESSAASLQNKIQQGRDRLAIGQHVSETLTKCAETIQPFAAAPTTGGGSNAEETAALEQISSRYTMQSEREIHMQLAAGDSELFFAEPPAAVDMTTDETEFGENVELF